MASNTGPVVLCCTYEGKKFTVSVRGGMKTREVINDVAKRVNVKPEELSALWRGELVPNDSKLQDIMKQAATDLHLVKLTREVKSVTTALPLNKEERVLYVYCKECESVGLGKPIHLCRNCNQSDKFILDSSEYEEGDLFCSAQTKGRCSNTECSLNNQLKVAKVLYVCRACNEQSAILKHFQDNSRHKIHCMKCNNVRPVVVVFGCQWQHVLCHDCFSGYCQFAMNNDRFRLFEDVCYSVCCPGPKCADCPILDPHHFYAVNKDFYKMYQQKSMEHYQPPGKNIFCSCKKEIDLDRVEPVTVDATPPVTPVQDCSEQGGSWFRRFFNRSQPKKTTSPPPTPVKRKQIKCPSCQVKFCLECKSFWHEGDCVTKKTGVDDIFEIYPLWEEAARWPKTKSN